MATPPKPWKAEYAKSSRSSCKVCRSPIEKETLRLGKMVQATQFDGFMPMWNHSSCIMRKSKQIKALDDVEGLESLRWEDQQKLRKYIESGETSNVSTSVDLTECKVEASTNSRASCRHCSEKIMKDEVRISKVQGKTSAWHHAKCFIEVSPNTQVQKLTGYENLSPSDQSSIHALINKDSSTSKGVKLEIKDEKEEIKPSNVGKRKREIESEDSLKLVKGEKDVFDQESQLEVQSKTLWALKDDLKKHVNTSELREMLEENDQESKGSELDLREHCADGMLFGALDKCPNCEGHIRYSGSIYKCHGYISAWSKCSYTTTEPKRVNRKWKIPQDSSNEYLIKWNKAQKLKKPARLLPISSSSSNANADLISRSSQGENLSDLRVAITGTSKETMEWKSKIEESGGQFHKKITKETNCLVVSGALNDQDGDIKKARRMKIPIVREDYLVDCINKKKKLPFDMYKIESIGEKNSTMIVKVKGRSAVHEASDLQDSGHILEHGKSIYNTTLSMSDLSTGINSYYILQIIEEDKGSECYVFRKWGRVGNEKIGGTKLQNMSKFGAIEEFKRLFLEKTGNPWEAWEQKANFEKHPGKFYPLEIDYGVDKNASKKKKAIESESKLEPPLKELMTMLFNVETYRAAMMEFEINMSEMPLGKLSKSNIQKGYEALTEIQNLLKSDDFTPSAKDSRIIDASNRFFTVIPSIHPHAIKDEDDFKSKVKMLEALQDIEIASKLVGFDDEDDDTLDDKYKKLNCNISPISHDSEEFQLINKYLQNTHAPTHTEWALELEEVFSLEREGEYDKYAPYREKLKNKMLLWHGSRLTNYVGILNQGLRIAPPEAPVTGYMFGKGIYFADLVSKSAQYCYTDRKNPVGLMLLSEVALGEIHELTKAKYMDKPPRGKNSTKGIGKKVPLESEFVKWKDDVTVPCGRPVPSKVKASELMYNEYIVYDTAQVKLQFLLKVRFHHKR